MHALEINRPAKLPKMAGDHSISVTRKLANELQNLLHQSRFVVTYFRLITLTAARLVEDGASPALRNSELFLQRVHSGAFPLRA